MGLSQENCHSDTAHGKAGIAPFSPRAPQGKHAHSSNDSIRCFAARVETTELMVQKQSPGPNDPRFCLPSMYRSPGWPPHRRKLLPGKVHVVGKPLHVRSAQ